MCILTMKTTWCWIQSYQSTLLTLALTWWPWRRHVQFFDFFFFCIKSLILKSLFSSDRRLSEQWPSWRLLWTSVSGSGRWFRSRGPPYGRCAALDWPAWGIWATAATSTLSCKCSSLFQTSRASQYPHLLLWFIRFLDDIWAKLLFHIIIGIFLTLTNSES